jgi:hypothetical protein
MYCSNTVISTPVKVPVSCCLCTVSWTLYTLLSILLSAANYLYRHQTWCDISSVALLSIVHRWCWRYTFPPISSIPLSLSEVCTSPVASSLSPPPQYTYHWYDIQLTPDILDYTKLSCIKCATFWVFSRRLVYIGRRFGTFYLFHLLGRWFGI